MTNKERVQLLGDLLSQIMPLIPIGSAVSMSIPSKNGNGVQMLMVTRPASVTSMQGIAAGPADTPIQPLTPDAPPATPDAPPPPPPTDKV